MWSRVDTCINDGYLFTVGKGYVALESVEYPGHYVGINKDSTPRTPSDTQRGRNGQFYVIAMQEGVSDNAV